MSAEMASDNMNADRKYKPGWMAVAALFLMSAAEIARAFTSPSMGELWMWYGVTFSLFFVLYFAVLWRLGLPGPVLHVYFALQSALVFGLLYLNPRIDFLTGLYAMLAYQAGLVLAGRDRWFWVIVLVLLSPISLMVLQEPLQGLALGLSPMVFAIVLAAFVAVNEELENAREHSQTLLHELGELNSELEQRAAQAEEFAALEERNRLARELHDSVSQTLFSIILNTRSAQILLGRDLAQVRPLLDRLQMLTQDALSEMRGLIVKLRPQSE